MSVVFITHDLGVVANVADWVAVMYAGKIVEYGTAKEVFHSPEHPYTKALLKSLPQLGIKGHDLYSIQGTPPSLFKQITGDAFAPRNVDAMQIDFAEEPPVFAGVVGQMSLEELAGEYDAEINYEAAEPETAESEEENNPEATV